MNPNYSQPLPPRNDTPYSESPLPAGFINPFASQNAQLFPAVENVSASVEPRSGFPEIPIALSASTSIQALQPFSQDHAQSQLNLPRQRLQRQSFDISMLPPHTASKQRQQQLLLDQQNDAGFAKPSSLGVGNISSASGQLAPGFRLQSTQMPQPIQHHSIQSSTGAQQSRQSPTLDPNRASIGVMSIGNTGISDIALLLSGAIKLKTHTSGKPPYSYATLITYAIMKHPRKQMTLNEIYTWVMEHYPYFKTAGSGWKNSIRHNLSLSKTFVRIPRPINEPGKGAYWTVDLAVLDATMSNQPNPQTNQLPPTREQQIYETSGNNAGIPQRYPLAPHGVPTLPTQGLTSGILAPGPFAMGMTSSVSEMGLVQDAPFSESSLALRRASLQSLPTHGRYQPYPIPAGLGLGTDRPQYHGMGPGSSYAQQILSNLNPFAMSAAANMFGGANGSLQTRTPELHSGVSEHTRPQPMFPPLPTDINRGARLGISLMSSNTIPAVPANISSSSSGIHDPSVWTQAGKPNVAVLRQDSKISASDIDEYTFAQVPPPGHPKSQQEASSGDAELTTPPTAISMEAYSQVKPTPSLPDYLLASHSTTPDEASSRKPPRQSNMMSIASRNAIFAANAEQDGLTQSRNHADQSAASANNNTTGTDLSAYFAFNGT